MIEYLTLEELLVIQSHMIKRFGGLIGIRDKNLLNSAIELPKSTMFGKDLYPGVFEKAAIYLFAIVRNHPFNDGNKRTGGGAAYLFLQANKTSIKFTDSHFENLILGVANGHVTKEEITQFFKKGKL